VFSTYRAERWESFVDRSVTVRYFQLTAIGEAEVPFEDAIEQANRLGNRPSDRAKRIPHGAVIRLERKRMNAGLLTGEVVREQRENIPPEATDDALVPLGVRGLGHSVAFVYDSVSRVIAIQFDPRGVSLGRFLDYLTAVNRNARYRFEAVVSDDAWARYNRGDPRSITFKIASPENLDVAAGGGSALSISKRLAEISDGASITVQISMGTVQQRNLRRDFVDSTIRLLTGDGAADRVKSLKVKSKPEGQPTDEIDFVKDFARDHDELELPSDNHAENYRRRAAFVMRSFKARIDEIRDGYA